jgi:hypothetical protein
MEMAKMIVAMHTYFNGDNHCGYIGFRNLGGTIWDGWKDGAIKKVVLRLVELGDGMG